MAYKLIAADIDGTLLTNDRRLTERTEAAIRAAKEKGVLFTLSTGRPLQGIRRYAHLLSENVPVITYNGSVVLTADTQEVLYSAGLPDEAARLICREAITRDVTAVAWAGGQLYARRINDDVMDYRLMTMEMPILVPHEQTFLEATAGQVTKMLWIDTPDTIARYMKEMNAILPGGVKCVTSNPRYLEFIRGDVSKSAALASAAEHLGITREEVIAVGDGLNDLDMITWAGTGVAMGNAADAVKEAADLITSSNEEDGLARVIEKLIL